VRRARRVREVKKLLSRKGPGIVFAMIQKMQDRDLDDLGPDDEVGDLGLLNEDESILVMVDEAHRSHTNTHSTATSSRRSPTAPASASPARRSSWARRSAPTTIFGEFIDRYTIKEAEEDGATVPILYEGRTAEGAVSDGRDLDQLFEDLFHGPLEAEREAIKRKYGTKGSVFEAERLIEAKAADMLRHYVEHILPNGLKAQVVAYSRRAPSAIKRPSRRRGTSWWRRRSRWTSTRGPARRPGALKEAEEDPSCRAGLARARRLLKQLEFAAVISPDNNDPRSGGSGATREDREPHRGENALQEASPRPREDDDRSE
jgi:type I restriction enzyme R subunit